MINLGLLGFPLGHSLSPKIHAAALRASGMDGDFLLYPIPPADEQGLQNLLARIRSGEIAGLSVTIPYKQTVIKYLDWLTPTAHAIGAVNCIYLQGDRLLGDNTDARGFMLDLKSRFDFSQQSRAHVLGAGGAARAVLFALLEDGWKVSVASRRTEQARALASAISPRKIDVAQFDDTSSGFDLLVNATPIGMYPNLDESPWPARIPLPSGAAVYDLIYNPRETLLVRTALAQGLRASGGLGMLVEQAAAAFTLWTGHSLPTEVFYAALEEHAA